MSIYEDSFQVKKPVAIHAVAKEERAKNCSAAQVFNAMKGVGTPNGSEQLELAGGGSLTRQDIENATRGIRSDLRSILPSTGFVKDVAEAEVILDENGWLYRQYNVTDAKGEKRWGLAFGHPERLEILKCRSHLTLFDSTHKLDRWKHNMFSSLVRDEQGTWILVTHCVIERENGETLSEALWCFKIWCPGWTPRYVMTDDSSIE